MPHWSSRSNWSACSSSRLPAALLVAALALAATDAAAQHLRVVVLGSSTAAGVGPVWPDSAWVPRYARYALELDPRHEIVNLARSGYTTYHVLPTGQAPPAGRPAPDPARNISAALALRPDAIVVNLPSNDAALGYSVEEQLRNYDTLRAASGAVPLWIATPQPRNLAPAGLAILLAMRDSTLSRYAPRTIDFWSGLARPDGTIQPLYDSGDGTHLNSAGHRVLFERAVAARILGEVPTAIGDGPAFPARIRLQLRPNPFRCEGRVVVDVPSPAHGRVEAFDALGRRLATLYSGFLSAGRHELEFSQLCEATGSILLAAHVGEWTTVRLVTSR